MNIRKKLVLTYVLIALSPLLVVSYLSYKGAEGSIIKIEQENLQTIMKARIETIKQYFAVFRSEIKSMQGYYSIYTNLPILDDYLDDQKDKHYVDALSNIDRQLFSWEKDRGDIIDVMFTDSRGKILYSLNPVHRAVEVGKVLPVYSQSFEEGKKGIFISKLFSESLEKEKSIVFIVSAPVNDLVGNFIGVAMIEVDATELFSRIQDVNGLEETGETLIGQLHPSHPGVEYDGHIVDRAGEHVVYQNILRHDNYSALNRTIFVGDGIAIPIQRAINGESGVGYSTDYRGKEVMAAWGFIPVYNWGIVTKIDKEEVLRPIIDLRNHYAVIYIIVSIIILIFTRYLSITLADSFNKLAEANKKIAAQNKELEKFKLATDNASDHIVITDPEGIVQYGNKAMEQITGYTISETLGKKAGKLWSLPMPKEYYVKMWDTIKNKKQVFVGEIRNRRKNGEEYDAAIGISPILNESGKVTYFVGLERDISKEKQIDRAKTEFVSLASHQLRTPLSTINWYSEMLLAGDAGKLNKTQKQYLEEVYRGNQRMVDLVNALLNVSRLELGTFAIEPEPTDFTATAKSVIDELEPQLKTKKHKLKTSYGKNLPKMQADPNLLRIIFQNLLSNAVKYTPAGGKIDLDINLLDKGESVADKKLTEKSFVIKVVDTGLGIPLNQKDKIFTKLFRADNVRKSDTEGTGLGLYIVKSIIDNSGGLIWFESEENKGTTFYATLPATGMKKKIGTKSLA